MVATANEAGRQEHLHAVGHEQRGVAQLLHTLRGGDPRGGALRRGDDPEPERPHWHLHSIDVYSFGHLTVLDVVRSCGGDHAQGRDRRRAGAASGRGGSGRTDPPCSCSTASRSAGTRGATNSRRWLPRASTSSPPTSAATPARARPMRSRTTRCCTWSATRSACSTRWARSGPWSSGTTGARRSPGTPHCCGPIGCRASSRCPCRCCRAARGHPRPRWRAASAPTSTSCTSSAPGSPTPSSPPIRAGDVPQAAVGHRRHRPRLHARGARGWRRSRHLPRAARPPGVAHRGRPRRLRRRVRRPRVHRGSWYRNHDRDCALAAPVARRARPGSRARVRRAASGTSSSPVRGFDAMVTTMRRQVPTFCRLAPARLRHLDQPPQPTDDALIAGFARSTDRTSARYPNDPTAMILGRCRRKRSFDGTVHFSGPAPRNTGNRGDPAQVSSEAEASTPSKRRRPRLPPLQVRAQDDGLLWSVSSTRIGSTHARPAARPRPSPILPPTGSRRAARPGRARRRPSAGSPASPHLPALAPRTASTRLPQMLMPVRVSPATTSLNSVVPRPGGPSEWRRSSRSPR